MKCPNCNKDVYLIPSAENNLESYHTGGSSVLATSECCGVAFKVTMETSFNYELYIGDKIKDDWGNEIKKLNLEKIKELA